MRPETKAAARQRTESLAYAGRYSVVVIDPPWPTKGLHGRTGPSYYENDDLMSIDEIRSMPVMEILEDNAFVFLWTINTHIPHTFEIFEEWGVEYMFSMVWHKPAGPQPSGRPQYNAEHIIVGRRGKPKFVDTTAFKLINEWPRRGHSVKPEEFYELIRRVTAGPRLDVFARREIEGFTPWGHESPCTEHEWVLPAPIWGRITIWGICSNCGETEEFIDFGRGMPEGPEPLWTGWPLWSSVNGKVDETYQFPDDSWRWDYAEWSPAREYGDGGMADVVPSGIRQELQKK